MRITGGEPLIHGSTYRLLDEINKNPMPNLELNINSNIGANPKLFDRFIEKLKPIIERKKVKKFKLFTSIDSWHTDKAEYMRHGLDVELFQRNLRIAHSEARLTFLQLILGLIMLKPIMRH